jgi:hypothetical protein
LKGSSRLAPGEQLLPLKRERSLPPNQARLANILQRLKAPAPLSEIQVARVRRRLSSTLAAPRARHFHRWLSGIVVSAACIFFLQVAAAAAMAMWPAMRTRASSWVSEQLGARHRGASRPPPELGMPAQSPQALPAPVTPVASSGVAGQPQDVPPTPNGNRIGTNDSARSPLRNALSIGAIGEAEIDQVASALTALHVRHDPESALAGFEAYAFAHPRGLLRGEAVVGQIEALILLERDREALALLDVMNSTRFSKVPRSANLRLLRAELLEKLDRCPEALPVLEEYQRSSTPAPWYERALIAQASCRVALKDTEGGREDFQRYVREFPKGRFAPRALMEIAKLQHQ